MSQAHRTHRPLPSPIPIPAGLGPYTEQQKQTLREEMQCVKDWTIDCLKEPETGCREGEGREGAVLSEQMRCAKDWVTSCLNPERGSKKTTLRVIKLNSALSLPRPRPGYPTRFHLDSVKAEEYKV